MPDVIDFLVLRQFYDEARQRDWQSCESVLISFISSGTNLCLTGWASCGAAYYCGAGKCKFWKEIQGTISVFCLLLVPSYSLVAF